MVAEFRTLIAELGLVDALLYAAARAIGRISGGRLRLAKFHLFVQPVQIHELTPRRRGRSIDVVEVEADQIRSMDFGRPREVIEYRLRHRCRCLVARMEGRMLGFQWFSTQDYPEDTVRCLYRLEPQDRCAWDFDIFVQPEARVLPVFPRLWDRCNEVLRNSGIDLSLSRIDAFNATSRRAHARIGARAAGWAVFLSTGALQLALFSDPPWIHISTSAQRVPTWPVSRLARRRRWHERPTPNPIGQ